MNQPKITIGILSYNRLHYLRALIASARECIRYDNLEWIVIDNQSIEPGLREYLDGLDFVDHMIFKECTHVEAMNTIIETSSADYVLLMPEDAQFIVRGDWIQDFVELLGEYPHIGGICFDAQRNITVSRFFPEPWPVPVPWRRRYKTYTTNRGRVFHGYGSTKPGIIGAGILSFARKEVWKSLGPWKTTGAQTVKDSSAGGESEMLQRYKRMGMDIERVITATPIAADIVTDPRGTKARIRSNRRYGAYWPPPEGDFYYHIHDQDEADRIAATCGAAAPGFEDFVKPLGFELPLDGKGNLRKQPFVDADDPFEWVVPPGTGEGKAAS